MRDRIDAADQTIMARLSAERSPVLDGFLPMLSRSADFFALWIGIAAVLAMLTLRWWPLRRSEPAAAAGPGHEAAAERDLSS